MKKKIVSIVLALAFAPWVVVSFGCRALRVDVRGSPVAQDGSDSTGGSQGGSNFPISLSSSGNIYGFSSTGGYAKSEKYVHFSDPGGMVSGTGGTEGGSFAGSVGIEPSIISGVQ